MTKPVIVFIPGSFSRPDNYLQIINPVKEHGFEVHGLHLPSVGLSRGEGRPTPPATMYEDAAHIAGVVEKLADEGKDVILIPHSYGGIPTTQSIQGLGKDERKKAGKEGGVVRIAYITSLVPAVGFSAATMLAELPQDNAVPLNVDEQGWMYHKETEPTAKVVFNLISPEEGNAFVREFSKHSAVSFAGELTYPGYKDVPVSYLFCEEDLCIPTSIQRKEIDMIEKESGRKVDVTSLKSDHCPNISCTQETLDWILDVARKSETK